MSVEAHVPLSFGQFVASQVDTDVRLEFVDGRVYAMAGGTDAHDLAVSQIARRFFGAEEHGCRVFTHSRLLRTRLRDATYYPDVMVVCGPRADQHWEDNATVVVEVASPSTRDRDRREKALAYSTLPSLQTYIIVDLELGQFDVSVAGVPGWRSYGAGDVVLTPAGDLDVSAILAAVEAQT